MAKVIEAPALMPRNGTCYPWKDWLDGRVWELTREVDFKPTVVNFKAAAYMYAKKNNVKVTVLTIDDKTVHLQARPK